MKLKTILLLAGLGISTIAFSQEAKKAGPPAGKALVGDFYGKDVNANATKKAMSVADLEKKLAKNSKQENVSVKGKVVDVCEKKGCWLTIETPDESRFFVKMKDYAFFVPTALKGKTVVLEGNAETKEVSVNEMKHYAEDAKKPQEEIDAITKPGMETRFMANGIKVVN